MKITKARLSALAMGAGAVIFAAGSAMAADEGIGGRAKYLNEQMSEFFPLMGTFAQFIGVLVALAGLFGIVKYFKNTHQNEIGPPLIKLGIASLFIGLPMLLGVGVSTFFEGDNLAVNQNDSRFGVERQ